MVVVVFRCSTMISGVAITVPDSVPLLFTRKTEETERSSWLRFEPTVDLLFRRVEEESLKVTATSVSR